MAKPIKQRKFECEERSANGLVYRRILLPKFLDDILTRISGDINLNKLNIRGFPINKNDKPKEIETKAMAILLGSVVANHFGELMDWAERGKKNGWLAVCIHNGCLSTVGYPGNWNPQPLQMQIDLERLKRELENPH
jgi:hypothetical protein